VNTQCVPDHTWVRSHSFILRCDLRCTPTSREGLTHSFPTHIHTYPWPLLHNSSIDTHNPSDGEKRGNHSHLTYTLGHSLGRGVRVWAPSSHTSTLSSHTCKPPRLSSQGFAGWIVQVVRYMILCNGFIPISLYITLEVIKVFQCVLVSRSEKLMHGHVGYRGRNAVVVIATYGYGKERCRCHRSVFSDNCLQSVGPLPHPLPAPSSVRRCSTPTWGCTIGRPTRGSTATPPR